jgi:hypothetical protein
MIEIKANPTESQRLSFEQLGFTLEPGFDSHLVEWSGYGLRLIAPSKAEFTPREAMAFAVDVAKALGKEEQQANARAALEIITGKL